MKSIIEKKFIDNHDHEFKIGEDICFMLNRNSNKYKCFGVIEDITTEGFTISNVLIDSMHVSDVLDIKFNEVVNGLVRLTDSSWF